ncbi:MAG: substrate-binding domain-containing protein [Firmicutes bacterium]|nr:substrate-binding domain-containing protein [Bacillota bacterium]
MKKRNILLLFLWCAGILFLMAASFTNLIFDENREKVYNISIVLDDDQKMEYENLKAGLNEALKGQGVKIYYLNLFGCSEQEMQDKIQEHCEIKDMLIVKCDVSPRLQSLLEKCDSKKKIICLNGSEKLAGSACNIRTDAEERGRSLAQRICREQGEECTIYVFGSAYEKLSQDACAAALASDGMTVVPCLERSDADIRSRLKEIQAQEGKAAVVAMKTGFLKNLVELQVKENTRIPLYGFGYDSEILKFMENGKIQAVNVIPDYYMGYLGMKTALLSLDKKLDYEDQILDSCTVGRDELFSEEYEDMLFPKK